MKRRGFSLIELLVVIAIISMIIAILLPTLSRCREAARKTVCGANLKQVATGIYNYWTEWNGRVPYVETPMTNGGFGQPPALVPDSQVDPFDREKWPMSLPNVLMPRQLGEDPRLFVCPSAINGWPRSGNSAPRYTYREAAANQPNGVVTPEKSYERDSFGFLDGRIMVKLRIDYDPNANTVQGIIQNTQNLAKLRGTYLRDLVQMRVPGDPVVGPHSGGINVLNRDLHVEYRSPKVAYEDLAPNGAGVAF